mmetsp:Transcript_30760/g.73248  ORF Transcript_30760/g.73248 Transcript_30760/m.73248 type:complete len:213 (+) Transcript_30760:1285-1923(+)
MGIRRGRDGDRPPRAPLPVGRAHGAPHAGPPRAALPDIQQAHLHAAREHRCAAFLDRAARRADGVPQQREPRGLPQQCEDGLVCRGPCLSGQGGDVDDRWPGAGRGRASPRRDRSGRAHHGRAQEDGPEQRAGDVPEIHRRVALPHLVPRPRPNVDLPDAHADAKPQCQDRGHEVSAQRDAHHGIQQPPSPPAQGHGALHQLPRGALAGHFL